MHQSRVVRISHGDFNSLSIEAKGNDVSGFVNVLAGNLRGLVGVLNNIAKAKA
jgi:hypothetical protein